MSSKSSRNPLKDQLIKLTLDIEDSTKTVALLKDKVDRETASLKPFENSIRNEFNRQYESKLRELQEQLSDLETKSSLLFTEKVNTRKECEDLISLMNEDEHEYSTEIANLNKDSDRRLKKERERFNDGHKQRLSAFLSRKQLEIQEATTKDSQSEFNRIQLNHDNDIAEVDIWLRQQQKQLQDVAESRYQTEKEQERLAAREELKVSLKYVVDKGKDECDAELRDHQRQLRLIQDTQDKELEKLRALLQDKSNKLRHNNKLELKGVQEDSQQRLLDLKARHAAYLEQTQNAHDELIQQLKQSAKQSLAKIEASFRSEQHLALSDELLSDSEGEGSSKVSPSKSSLAGSKKKTLSPKDPLSEELAQRKRDAEAQRDKQLQRELRELETESLRLERSWKLKSDQEKQTIVASQQKEEELLNKRISHLNEELAGLVVDRERLHRLTDELKQQEDSKVKSMNELKKNIGVYRDGIASNRQLIKDKEALMKSKLRELQLEWGPVIRQHKEHCDQIETDLRRNERAVDEEMRDNQRQHAHELEALDKQVTIDVHKIEQEIAALNDRIDTERVKNNKLLALLKKYNNGAGNATSSQRNHYSISHSDSDNDDDDEEPRARPALRQTATSSASAVSRTSSVNTNNSNRRGLSSTYSTASTVTHATSTNGQNSAANGATGRLRPGSASVTSRLSRK